MSYPARTIATRSKKMTEAVNGMMLAHTKVTNEDEVAKVFYFFFLLENI